MGVLPTTNTTPALDSGCLAQRCGAKLQRLGTWTRQKHITSDSSLILCRIPMISDRGSSRICQRLRCVALIQSKNHTLGAGHCFCHKQGCYSTIPTCMSTHEISITSLLTATPVVVHSSGSTFTMEEGGDARCSADKNLCGQWRTRLQVSSTTL